MDYALILAPWLIEFPARLHIVRAGERYPLGVVETPDSGRYALEALADAGQHGRVRLHVRADRGPGDRAFWVDVAVEPHGR